MRTAPFHNTIEAIVVGASAGAVDALLQILPSLPPAFPIPVLIVVHLPPTASVSLASVLSAHCRIPVKEAEDKEPIQAGTIYVAPPNYHLLVEPSRKLSLSMDEPVLFSRPSIDVLFESAADSYGTSVAGVILTGANSDGARGLRAIAAARGIVLVQEPASAEASAMPQAALEACPSAHVLSLAGIARFLSIELLAEVP